MDFPIHFPFPQFFKQTVKTDKVNSIFLKEKSILGKLGFKVKYIKKKEGMDEPSSKKRNANVY